jgi:hypothetical protein
VKIERTGFEDPPKRRSRRGWLLLVEVCSVVGGVLAVLAFFGIPNLQSLRPFSVCAVIRCGGPPAPSPSPQPPAPTFPQPQTWRPPNNLADESWILDLGDRKVRFDFNGDSTVRISDPDLGGGGRWTPLGRNQVRVETPSREMMGTMTGDGEGMSLVVSRSDGQSRQPQLQYVTLRRVR